METALESALQEIKRRTARKTGKIDDILLAQNGPSTSLRCDLDSLPLYFQVLSAEPSFDDGYVTLASEMDAGGVATNTEDTILGPELERGPTAPQRLSRRAMQRRAKRERESNGNTGKMWFNMPATKVTPEIETTLKLIRMRHVLDPKHFMKRAQSHRNPKYFQIGRMMNGPGDSRSADAGGKKRLVDHLLKDDYVRRYHKAKFNELQARRAARGLGARRWKKRRGTR